MIKFVELVALIVLAVGIPGLLLFFFGNITYRVSRHEVEVLFLHLVIRKITLQEISDVKVGLFLPCEIWPTLRIFRGRFLSIRRKRGFGFRYLVITPRDPESFRRNLCFALNWKP